MAAASLDQELAAVFASDPRAIADPFPVWNQLREESAVYPLGDLVLVARHADISAILRDTRFLSNTKGRGSQFEAIRARLAGAERAAFDEVTAFEANYVSRSNGEAHARLRRIAQRAFMPQRITALRERCRWHMDDLLAATKPGEAFDLKTIAYRLPLRIIGELLEIPPEDLEQIHAWSEAIGRNRGGTDTAALMAAHRALREFRAYTEALVDRHRGQDGRADDGSLVGLLMGAEQEERLSAVELTAMFVILLFAGHETTTNLIASGVHQLLAGGQWPILAADQSLIPNAIEEMLRYVTPVQFAGRVPSSDIDWGGVVLREGTTMHLILAAGNRDPSVFQDPDRIDIRRPDARRHLAFGSGPHLCIGLQLARLEAAAALTALIARCPTLELAGADLRWGGHIMLRGLVSLPVRTAGPAAAAAS
jgi:cytochrome P450